jgi:CBS domain-containing protein
MQAKLNSRKGSDVNFNFNMSWKKDHVISISPSASIQEIARLMKEHHIGDVLVIEGEGENRKLLGIVTDRDLALCFCQDRDLAGLKAADVMSSSVVTAPIDSDFFLLVNLMNQTGITRLPLTESNGQVVSIVTAKNLLQILVSSLFELTQISEQQSENERGNTH